MDSRPVVRVELSSINRLHHTAAGSGQMPPLPGMLPVSTPTACKAGSMPSMALRAVSSLQVPPSAAATAARTKVTLARQEDGL